MSGESSTPGGALDSISRVGEACCIQIGRNDVFLECFHERKGSITTQQKFEEKGLIVSTLFLVCFCSYVCVRVWMLLRLAVNFEVSEKVF